MPHCVLCGALCNVSFVCGGGLLQVDMFAHHKSGIAYRDRNRRSETVASHKREPHQQPRLLPTWYKLYQLSTQLYQMYQLST
jgi:hypothetical protein